jgi:hypothetical protein
VLGAGVEVHGAHAIDELRQLVDAAAVLRVRRRPRVVIADHAVQVETAEALANRAQQVLAFQVHALDGHLVLTGAAVELVELVAQRLQLVFLGVQRLAVLVEQLTCVFERFVRFLGAGQGLDAGFAPGKHLGCRLAVGGGGVVELDVQALRARGELGQ